jgi:flagellar biosynthesis anti-sigma factor FlgM
MTSRFDGNQGTPLPVQVDRTEAARAGEHAQKPGAPVKADRVEVSRDAAFVNEAVQAANQAPAIRHDKVEQAKKALADGTLGADSAKLAEAIIDQMLGDNK